jgi:DNA polymerase-1
MPKTSPKKDKKKIVLLDSHAIIHRAYHALPDFNNSQGEPTGAIYGLATMLFKIISELKPDYIIACFDLPKKTFRHEAYVDYKSGRAKADDALAYQLTRAKDFFKALSIPVYEKEGFEADDLLGTITEQLKNKKEDYEIIIASGDMDTLQLVKKDFIYVYTLKKGINDTILYGESKVIERFGFSPSSLPDYKGLRGDPSDNIIGIKGIGEKTATILISKYQTIENLYKNIKKKESDIRDLGITDRILTLLKEGEEEALFSKTLATIRLDAPVKFDVPKRPWIEEVNKNDVASFFRELEFRSLQGRFLKLFDKGGIPEDKTIDKPIKKEDEDRIKKAQIAFWLLNSERTNPDMDEVIHYKGSQSLDEAITLLEGDIKKEQLDYVYRNIEIPIIPIIDKIEKKGIKIDVKYFEKISGEYHKDLAKIESQIFKLAGQEFNINSPKQIGEIIFGKLGISTKGIKKSAGGSMSTRESELEKLNGLHPIIGEILKHRELQKLLSTYIDTIPALVSEDGRLHANFIQTGTTTGRFASNNPNLQNIPVRSERGKNIRNAFVADTGNILISFDYSQIELRVAALLSQDPYFIKSFKEGKDIHQAVAMKVFGVSEKDLTKEMRRRAKIINFGILYGMGVNALRQNLLTEDSNTGQKTEVGRQEAQNLYDNYFAQFPKIESYLESIKDFAKKYGYTKTLFGRKRYFPTIKSPIPFIRAMAERMAINAPIQGTATADIIKIGMKKAEEALVSNNLLDKADIVLQVHDELIYEAKEEYEEKISKIIKQALENIIPKDFLSGKEEVPLVVSVSSGKTWGDLV